jgi:hypothetical protein
MAPYKPAPGQNEDIQSSAVRLLTPANPGFPYTSVYTSLRPQGATAFRVVRLLPGSGHDALKCELIPSNLGPKAPRYEALSYCAGDPSECESIVLNGHEFKTFRSTFEVMCRLRHAKTFRYLWIDQICINQTNIQERDSQVLLMTEIYRHAARTQIWLGEAAEDPPSSLAFELLKDFLRTNREDLRAYIMKMGVAQPGYRSTGDSLRDYLHAEYSWWAYYHSPRLEERQNWQKEGRHDNTLEAAGQWFMTAFAEPNYIRSWPAFYDLFKRPWWKRCWVVQEVAVSGDVIVNCGLDSIAWEDLSLLLCFWHVICTQTWKRLDFHDAETDKAIRFCHSLYYRIHIWRKASLPASLGDLLGILRESIASDPRDKIFSVLGMLSDGSRSEYAIVPSYTSGNETSEVYFATAEAILTQDLDLRLLTDISGREKEGGLPTWAPDWSQPALGTDKAFWDFFDAGAGFLPQMEILREKRELKICGCIVDGIKVVGPPDEGGEVADTLAAWHALFLSNSRLATNVRGLNSYYRALTLDTYSPILEPNADPEFLERHWSEIEVSHTRSNNKLGRQSLGWRFFVSDNDLPGMASKTAEPGDIIFIPWGTKMPFTVRRCADRADRYQLTGHCYLHEMMSGEVVSLEKAGKVQSDYIYLV